MSSVRKNSCNWQLVINWTWSSLNTVKVREYRYRTPVLSTGTGSYMYLGVQYVVNRKSVNRKPSTTTSSTHRCLRSPKTPTAPVVPERVLEPYLPVVMKIR